MNTNPSRYYLVAVQPVTIIRTVYPAGEVISRRGFAGLDAAIARRNELGLGKRIEIRRGDTLAANGAQFTRGARYFRPGGE